jgi:hypothetical protein
MKKPLTFTEACAQYVHRFTMEYKPQWANKPLDNGKYYAPQYRSDREWFENTLFPPHEFSASKRDTSCYSQNQSWPLGKFLTKPFTR